MIGITAAAKILTRPATLYQMATADIVNPLSRASQAMILSLRFIFIEQIFIPSPIAIYCSDYQSRLFSA
jgi:hypothetical protein